MVPAQKSVLILGGGFAGVRCALNLSKSPLFKVTLVDNKNYHTFNPDMYELLRSPVLLDKKIDFEQLESTVNIPYRLIFSGKKILVLKDQIIKVDLENRNVDGEKHQFKYDYLVLALGSTTCFYGVKGAGGFAHTFKSTQDALNIHNDLVELIGQKEVLEIVVVGGGFTGVEICGAIAELGKKLQKLYPQKKINLKLLEAAPHILNGMPAWAQRKAIKNLHKRGVEVELGTKILRVDEKLIYLEGSREIAFDYLLWTTGVEGQGLSIREAKFNQKKQILVDRSLVISNYPEAFVVGDLAATDSLPSAYIALNQAELVSQNIDLSEKNKPLKLFRPPHPSFVVPLGRSYGLANLFGLQISGVLAIFFKKLITLNYLVSILSLNKALSFWWKEVKLLDLSNEKP